MIDKDGMNGMDFPLDEDEAEQSFFDGKSTFSCNLIGFFLNFDCLVDSNIHS